MFISQRLEKDPKKLKKKGHSKYMQYNGVRSAHIYWSNCVRLREARVSGTPCLVTFITRNNSIITREKYKGKENGAGLARESQSHCFADEFVITHAHSFGTDMQHDYSQGN